MADKDMTIKCPHCDKVQKPHPWVYAHWDESLVGKCVACRKSFGFRAGRTWKEVNNRG